ncbi:MAG: TIGR00295 family protein [Candidatus Bathyarchaeia archaeon]
MALGNAKSPREKAVMALYKAGCPPNVIRHSLAVAELAMEISRAIERNGVGLDSALVEAGALLHDIGRSRTHGIDHAVVGASIVREMGFPEAIARIVEVHIGAGIPADEAEELGLPKGDYMPSTLEEKVVAYADKLIDGDRRITPEEFARRLSQSLGSKHPAISRFWRLHSEISALKDRKA